MKSRRYWLRGGLTAVLVVILLVVIVLLILSNSFPFTGRGGELSGPSGLQSTLVIGYAAVGIPILVAAFGFGALLGSIYGRIKAKILMR